MTTVTTHNEKFKRKFDEDITESMHSNVKKRGIEHRSMTNKFLVNNSNTNTGHMRSSI